MNGIRNIQTQFAKGKVFVAYLMAGDGGIEHTLAAALALIASGVTLLEIGVPFSDPIADGPVIQRAALRAIAKGTTLNDILWLTSEIRKHSSVPLILFTYLNPILSALSGSFFQEAQQAGIDGVLIIDCPIETSEHVHQQCLDHAIAPIYVIAPSTTAERIRKIDDLGQGCLYYACRKGTTGIRKTLPDDFIEKIQGIRANAQLPVIAGFGIATLKAAKHVLQYADGVVVGSLFVKALEEGMGFAQLEQLARSINPLVRNIA